MLPVSTLPSIFISYSRADSAFVDQLEAELSKYGFVTWLDRQHLEGGDDWAAAIEAQITCHDLVIVALSPDAIASEWVKREIAFAQQIRKKIIPVLAKPTQVPFRISELQYIEFFHNFEFGFTQLRIALSRPQTEAPSSQGPSSSSYTLTPIDRSQASKTPANSRRSEGIGATF
ncbi:MAG TPA: toll/interleukin-1 receptor domain-containing protein, partial [Ktedonobacteraceae bacterium]